MYPYRRSNRLKTHDYTSSGYYFITIVTKRRKRFFSTIPETDVGEARHVVPLLNNNRRCCKVLHSGNTKPFPAGAD
jgi:REP element-mobilizing transposase RayT